MKIRIVKGTTKISSKGDIVFHTFGGDMEFNAGQRNIWHGEQGIEIGEYEENNNWEKGLNLLILHSSKKKGRNRNDTDTALDMLYNDYSPENKGLAKLEEELYKEELTILREKFIIGNKENIARKFAKNRIEKIEYFLQKTDDELFKIFKDKIKGYSMGNLELVAIDIVDKMKYNKGGYYKHKNLNYAAKNHSNFIEFAKGVEYTLAKQIGKGKRIEDLATTLEIPAKNHNFYKAIVNNEIDSPKFNRYYDAIHGLQILVNDIWAYEVRILGYSKYNNILRIELQYDLYDHFGLDYPDIHKYDQDIFYVWFILQHFRGYKPLITHMEIQRTYIMIVPPNW